MIAYFYFGAHSMQLKFDSIQQEKEFQALHSEEQLNSRRFFIVFGVILYLVFIVLDRYMLVGQPKLLNYFIVLRLILAIIGSISLMTTFIPILKRYFIISLKILVLYAGGAVIAMIILSDGITSLTYPAGVMIVISFLYIFSLPFKCSFIIGWILILGYNIAAILNQSSLTLILNSNFFLISSNITGLFFLYYLEKKSRDSFLLNHRLTQAYDEIKHLALTDPLTGVKNRRYFQEVISEDLEKINTLYEQNFLEKRNQNICYGLLMLDIDHFKKVNDQLGHSAGDQVLKQVSKVIKEEVRHDDIVVRWGGEEFLVILKNINPHHLNSVAQKVKKKIEAHDFIYDEQNHFVKKTVSMGVVPFPFNHISLEEAIKFADYALYHSKDSGRNRVTVITSNTDKEIQITSIEQLVADQRVIMTTIE